MQHTVQAVVGTVAALLAGVAVIGALAMLIVAEGYYLVGFAMRLYLRCKDGMRQVRRHSENAFSQRQDLHGRPLDHPRTSSSDTVEPSGQSLAKLRDSDKDCHSDQ